MKEIDEGNEILNKGTPQINEDQQVENQFDFSDLNDKKGSQTAGSIDFLLDIPLEITIELGRTKMLINELLKLGQGSVVELEKLADKKEKSK